MESQLAGTKFLRSTGLLDAYEHVVSTMIMNGWPSDKSIFEHAAYELLKWGAEHKDEYRGLVGRSIEKRSELIFQSRDNIPELAEFKKDTELERHKMEIAEEAKQMQKVKRIELNSKKKYTLTTNKLDISIFEFKGRNLFQATSKKSEDAGTIRISHTMPAKKELARAADTNLEVDREHYEEGKGGEDDILRYTMEKERYETPVQ